MRRILAEADLQLTQEPTAPVKGLLFLKLSLEDTERREKAFGVGCVDLGDHLATKPSFIIYKMIKYQSTLQRLFRQKERGKVLEKIGPVSEQRFQLGEELYGALAVSRLFKLIQQPQKLLHLTGNILQGFTDLKRKSEKVVTASQYHRHTMSRSKLRV